MKTIDVQYFAILREQRGLGREKVSTAAVTAGELYAELGARHGFTLPAGAAVDAACRVYESAGG